MRAAVLVDVATLRPQVLPTPQPAPHEVLVRVTAVGLCGTDFHIFAGHANYHMDRRGEPVPLRQSPQILGHEIVGVVAEVGAAVTDLRPGDPVVLDQGRNCHSAQRAPACEYCASGDSHQCEHYAEHGITGLPGGLADGVVVPAVNAVRRTGPLAEAHAALTEPLACVLHSSDRVAHQAARYALRAPDPARRVRSVLVCGAGPAGLLFVQYLRQVAGFDGTLLVAEPNPHKRALAAQFGGEPLDPTTVDLPTAVRERTQGRRVEYLIEATGAGAVFAAIPGLLRKQGTVLAYGHGHHGTDLSALNRVLFLEPTLVAAVGASGGFDPDRRPAVYRRALQLLEQGTIQVAPLLSHHYRSLDAVVRAFTTDHRAADYCKGVYLAPA